jgi:hypothetical protein
MPFVSDTTRPPHPAPNVRDDRDTPLKWDGMAADIGVIWVRREPIYFCKGGLDDPNQLDPTEEFSLYRHGGFTRSRPPDDVLVASILNFAAA